MIEWRPIETAAKVNAEDVLLWHGRANVGSWFNSWPYDGRYPEAEKDGAWVIGGGYVVRPTMWAPIEPPRAEQSTP
jgi:hypothetical protein